MNTLTYKSVSNKVEKEKSIFMLLLTIIIASVFTFYWSKVYVILYIGIAIFFAVSAYVTFYNFRYGLAIAIFLSLDCFGLLPSINILGGTFSFSDLGIIWTFYLTWIMLIRDVHYRFDNCGIILITYFFFLILGSFVSNIIYNQNLLVGLLVFRKSYLIFAYLPIAAFYRSGHISRDQILDIILFTIKIYTIVVFAQLLLLYLNIDITNYNYKIRWGYRLYASNIPHIFGLFYMLFFTIKYGFKLKYFFWIVVFSLGVVFINQSRVAIFATAIVSCIIIIVYGNYKNRLALLAAIIFSIVLIFSVDSLKNIILDSLKEYSDGATSGNIYYREIEKMYFDSLLLGHELFGVGIPNMNSGLAAMYSGKTISGYYFDYYLSGAYTSDLGIYAIRYYFGYFGFAIAVFLFLKSLYKYSRNFILGDRSIYSGIVISFLIYQIVVCDTLFSFFESSIQYLLIFIMSLFFVRKGELKSYGRN